MSRRTNYGVCKVSGKRKFYSKKTAEAELRSTRKAASRQKNVKFLGRRRTERRVYECDDCKGWHLTSIGEWREP